MVNVNGSSIHLHLCYETSPSLPSIVLGEPGSAAWRITAKLVGRMPGQGVPLCSMDIKVSTELYWLVTEVETGQVCGAVHE